MTNVLIDHSFTAPPRLRHELEESEEAAASRTELCLPGRVSKEFRSIGASDGSLISVSSALSEKHKFMLNP